jgi:homoserine O-acetyltransferase
VAKFGMDQPLKLDCGIDLAPFQIAYQTYGELNADRSNAILICHALTGDQHVFNTHPITGKPGWWDTMVGPGLPLDTNQYFIICSNVIGGCMGSTGPRLDQSRDRQAVGAGFSDHHHSRHGARADHADRALGIKTLFCVVGGSMGGMQVLQWTAAYPERVFSALPIACRNAPFGAEHRVPRARPPGHHGRSGLAQRPLCRSGHASASRACRGAHGRPHHLSLGRRAASQVRRRMQDRDLPTFSFDADFQVESYLRYQGSSFVERFDANSYLYLTRAMDYFDIAADHDGVLAKAFTGIKTRFCVVSFTSDWLFPTSESRALVHALNASSARVSFAEIETDRGHDAFLLDVPEFFDISRAFLQSAGRARGLKSSG